MKTYHKQDCKRVFKNYDLSCLRCQELDNGATPREGWNDIKIQQEEIRFREITEHYRDHESCDYVRRGVPCVKFDH